MFLSIAKNTSTHRLEAAKAVEEKGQIMREVRKEKRKKKRTYQHLFKDETTFGHLRGGYLSSNIRKLFTIFFRGLMFTIGPDTDRKLCLPCAEITVVSWESTSLWKRDFSSKRDGSSCENGSEKQSSGHIYLFLNWIGG